MQNFLLQKISPFAVGQHKVQSLVNVAYHVILIALLHCTI